MTYLLSQNGESKVHYPLPLNPLSTGSEMLDKQTMQKMVQRMSQTLTEFKKMGNTPQQMNNPFSNIGLQTAKEFFSKENKMHPLIDENTKLK